MDTDLCAEAKEARKPPPPELLVDALQARIHVEGGRHPRYKPIRLRKVEVKHEADSSDNH
mgnify:FL=1